MFYLFGIRHAEVVIGTREYYGMTENITKEVPTEHLIAIFSTEEKAEQYVQKYTEPRGGYSYSGNVLYGYDSHEIREVPLDPE